MIKPTRYLEASITRDLTKKMVFVGGPRQVGKTTLAKTIGEKTYATFDYLNWDSREHRQKILKEIFSTSSKLIIFDELHKYRQWKNYLKGLYDTNQAAYHLLVTGSARLDVYRRGGDSLLGRYHYFRLHPFSLAELAVPGAHALAPGSDLARRELPNARAHFEKLLQWGGFPEPLFANDASTLRRWHNERVDRLIKEDIRDLESIRDLSGLQHLAELLPAKVGGLFSLNSLREDIQVAHKTIALWADVLERFYYFYRIYPYHAKRLKMLRKEPKVYLWDWSEVTKPSARLENIVASHLLKLAHFLYDTEGHKVELTFLRTQEGREVDFLLTHNGKPWMAVEVKSHDRKVSSHLPYFRERLSIPYTYQLVETPNVDEIHGTTNVMSIDTFLGNLV